jgi:hypothetical protein
MVSLYNALPPELASLVERQIAFRQHKQKMWFVLANIHVFVQESPIRMDKPNLYGFRMVRRSSGWMWSVGRKLQTIDVELGLQ